MVKSVDAIIKHMISRNNEGLNLSFPAVIVGVENLKHGLVDVQPIVNYKGYNTTETSEYPVLYNIRLIFPSTKNSTISFPVNHGDFVDLVFQSVDISKFNGGNTEPHDPRSFSFGNLDNVVAYIGYEPYQNSCLNPDNYMNDFDNQDLNIVHNKNTESEIIFKLTSEGDLKVTNAKKVSYECQEFEVTATEKIKFTAPLISENGR